MQQICLNNEMPEDIYGFFGHPLTDDNLNDPVSEDNSSSMSILPDYDCLRTIHDRNNNGRLDNIADLLLQDPFEKSSSPEMDTEDMDSFLVSPKLQQSQMSFHSNPSFPVNLNTQMEQCNTSFSVNINEDYNMSGNMALCSPDNSKSLWYDNLLMPDISQSSDWSRDCFRSDGDSATCLDVGHSSASCSPPSSLAPLTSPVSTTTLTPPIATPPLAVTPTLHSPYSAEQMDAPNLMIPLVGSPMSTPSPPPQKTISVFEPSYKKNVGKAKHCQKNSANNVSPCQSDQQLQYLPGHLPIQVQYFPNLSSNNQRTSPISSCAMNSNSVSTTIHAETSELQPVEFLPKLGKRIYGRLSNEHLISLLSAPLDPIPRPVKRKRPSSTKRVTSKKSGSTPAKKKTTPKTPKTKKGKAAAKSAIASSSSFTTTPMDSRLSPACLERISPVTSQAEPMETSDKLSAYDNIGDLFRPHYRNGLHLSGMPAAASVLPATTDGISPLTSLHSQDGKMIKRILIQNIQNRFVDTLMTSTITFGTRTSVPDVVSSEKAVGFNGFHALFLGSLSSHSAGCNALRRVNASEKNVTTTSSSVTSPRPSSAIGNNSTSSLPDIPSSTTPTKSMIKSEDELIMKLCYQGLDSCFATTKTWSSGSNPSKKAPRKFYGIKTTTTKPKLFSGLSRHASSPADSGTPCRRKLSPDKPLLPCENIIAQKEDFFIKSSASPPPTTLQNIPLIKPLTPRIPTPNSSNSTPTNIPQFSNSEGSPSPVMNMGYIADHPSSPNHCNSPASDNLKLSQVPTSSTAPLPVDDFTIASPTNTPSLVAISPETLSPVTNIPILNSELCSPLSQVTLSPYETPSNTPLCVNSPQPPPPPPPYQASHSTTLTNTPATLSTNFTDVSGQDYFSNSHSQYVDVSEVDFSDSLFTPIPILEQQQMQFQQQNQHQQLHQQQQQQSLQLPQPPQQNQQHQQKLYLQPHQQSQQQQQPSMMNQSQVFSSQILPIQQQQQPQTTPTPPEPLSQSTNPNQHTSQLQTIQPTLPNPQPQYPLFYNPDEYTLLDSINDYPGLDNLPSTQTTPELSSKPISFDDISEILGCDNYTNDSILLDDVFDSSSACPVSFSTNDIPCNQSIVPTNDSSGHCPTTPFNSTMDVTPMAGHNICPTQPHLSTSSSTSISSSIGSPSSSTATSTMIFSDDSEMLISMTPPPVPVHSSIVSQLPPIGTTVTLPTSPYASQLHTDSTSTTDSANPKRKQVMVIKPQPVAPKRSSDSPCTISPKKSKLTQAWKNDTVVKKCSSENGLQFELVAPISNIRRDHAEPISYLNKGHLYRLNLAMLLNPSSIEKSIKVIVCLTFIPTIKNEDILKLLSYWHLKVENKQNDIFKMDESLHSGIVKNSMKKISCNTQQFSWNPHQHKLAHVNFSVNCLSTEFIKRIKNDKLDCLPLHIKVICYNKSNKCIGTFLRPLKVFSDKGAERKIKSESKKNHNVEENIGRCQFYAIEEVNSELPLFIDQSSTNTASKVKKERSLKPTDSLPERVIIYVRKSEETVFTALFLTSYEVSDLSESIEKKYGVPNKKIRNIYRMSKKGIIMEVDHNVILHYTNEATFIISLEQYELYYDVILSEIDVDA